MTTHRLHLTPSQTAMGDLIQNRAHCTAPRCSVKIALLQASGLSDLDGEVPATHCCNLDCPRHAPNSYRGRHRA